MKKIFALLVTTVVMLICGINLHAQDNVFYPEGFMTFSNGDFSLNGEKIYEGDYHNYFNVDEFQTINGAMRQRKAGKGLLIAGGITAGIGLAAWIGGASVCTIADSEFDFYLGHCCVLGGISLSAVGLPLLAAGTPLYCIGNSRLRWAAENYNRRKAGMSLSLSAGGSGVGLTLKF